MPSTGARPAGQKHVPHELWTTAASVLARVLHKGGSLKSILAPMASMSARPINALVTETLKKRRLLERFVAACGPWDVDGKDVHELRLLLAHEALFGRGLRQPALSRAASLSRPIAEALDRIRAWEGATLKAAKAAGRGASASSDEPSSALMLSAQGEDPTLPKLPRYARVNTLKLEVKDAVRTLCDAGWQLCEPPTSAARSGAVPIAVADSPPDPGCFWLDPHVADLLVFPPHTELHAHSLVASAGLILQDKASCLAPAALAPRPGELVLDCCAAPGNKTTQLAALAAPGGKVIACERDARRAGVLRTRSAAAAGSAISVVQADFLSIDPSTPPYCDVSAIQLDPTCSGTGMVERAGFQMLESSDDAEAAAGGAASAVAGADERIRSLGAMQLSLLRHALSFPKARVVVYSTCSVHPIENELVVRAALADIATQGAGWTLTTALPAWPCRGLPLLPGAECLVRAGPEVQTNGFFVARFERRV